MRLGDLDALKKAFEEVYPLSTNEMGGVVNKRIYDIIDNAPTVEPFEPDYVGGERSKARQRGYEEGYHTGMEIGKTLNPKIKQGEWVRYRDNPHQPEHIKCSNCGQYWSIADHDKTFNFCFKCGAKMRGGEE